MNELPSLYSQYIHLSRYSRWREDLGRRETWEETVERYIDFMRNYVDTFEGSKITKDNRIWNKLKNAILHLEVMPSMRALMTAGPALEADHTCAYNCAFIAMDHPTKFSELMHVLLCGTGVGYSVERQYIAELPVIAEEFHSTDTVIKVSDSKAGWCRAVKEIISLLYAGQVPTWDLSSIRPAGARLKTFGGRASGPQPLDDLLRYVVSVFREAAGRKLNSIEVHDICCKIAEVVVVGGVRRSALLSLSNLTDQRMRNAKAGEFYHQHPERSLANNSVAYTEKPDIGIFMEEWMALYHSKSGERGIFNRQAAQANVPERRDAELVIGTNPCSEILLRDRQFCNLTEAVIRPEDCIADVYRKVKLATILGTMQSMLTNFKFLTKKWKTNCEEERLLGVSLTGIMDHSWWSYGWADTWVEGREEEIVPAPPIYELESLREDVVRVNTEWAKKLGIEAAAATTCIKPSGTVSQLVDSSSGIHPRFAPYYIRRVRQDVKDPITQLLIDEGVPHEKDYFNPSTMVFSFPMKSPKTSRTTQDDVSAVSQLSTWLAYAKHYCEHKPSVTIFVREHEWIEVAAWVYKNFDMMSGVSFLPHSDHVYKQAPYTAITEEEYNSLAAAMPKSIDWNKLAAYESEDNTTINSELACSAGVCDI